jgi:hypothetical protein
MEFGQARKCGLLFCPVPEHHFLLIVDGVLIDPQILCYLAVGDAVSVFEYDLLLGFQIYHFLSLFLLSV